MDYVAFERESYLCYQGIRLQRWRRKDLLISQPLSDWIDRHVHVCLYTRVQFTFPPIFSERGAGEHLVHLWPWKAEWTLTGNFLKGLMHGWRTVNKQSLKHSHGLPNHSNGWINYLNFQTDVTILQTGANVLRTYMQTIQKVCRMLWMNFFKVFNG